MRALRRPSWRQRPRVLLPMPSLAEICRLVSMPASSNRSLKLLSLVEKRTHPLDADRVEGVPGSGAQPALVEDVCHLGVGIFVEETVDLLAHVRVCGALLLSRQRAGQRQAGGCAATEADGGRDLALLDQGDVLDQEREHALALALRRSRVAPRRGEVRGEGEDALALVRVNDEPIGGTLALVIRLRLGEGPQPGIPVDFQRIGDEPIGGVDLKVPVARAVGLVLRPLDLPVAQAIGLLEARGDLLLHGQRELECHRRDRLDE